MGLNSKGEKRSADVSLLEDEENFERPNKRIKPMEYKGGLNSSITDEWKSSSGPPSPVPFLSPDGRITKPAEIFRTDLISAMKIPDTQILNPENYMTIVDPWRQEWERGVQVPVHPEGLPQPSFSIVETPKKTSTFKLSGKLLNSEDKRKGKSPCNYDLSRIDVEWLNNLNKSRRNKGRIELEEEALEKAISYLEDKCYENMGYAIVTQKGLSIEYDESVCCEVCQSPDSEEGNEMVFCDSCDICVHQACYGIQHIPSGSWLCQPCRRGAIKPPCQLCPNPGGAVKQTKKRKNWVHVSCALWVPEVGFGSVEKMEPIIKLENIPAKRWNLVCFLCREKQGACIQCTVKTCMTAFHVTCGFQHGLEMKTILDDTAVDGVRHLCYCAKHGYKNKSPPRSPEKTKQEAEDAENLRQKRLKQMETEFYKYVDVAEAAKDLNIPKELAAHIHSFWTLKRKARDDLPLLPPSLEQQEKLCGKQGVASRSLQIQIEELMKMRCDLERLRNLCYMVSKREKMRRELYRAREQVFWKAHEVMTDETIDIDENELKWMREACGKNFTGDGSEPARGPTVENSLEEVSTSSSAQSSNSEQTGPEDITGEMGQSNEPSECSESDVRGGYDSSDSEDSPQIKTRRRLRGLASHKSRKDVVNRLKSDSQDTRTERGANQSTGAKEAADSHLEVEEGECRKEGCDTPKRSPRAHSHGDTSLEQNSAVDSNDESRVIKGHSEESGLPQVMTRRNQRNASKQVTNDRGSAKAEESVRMGLTRPRTRGQTSDSTSEDTESTRAEPDMPPSPSRLLRSNKQRKMEPHDRPVKTSGKNRSRDVNEDTKSDLPRETRSTRSRRISSKSEEEEEERVTGETEPDHQRVPPIGTVKSLQISDKQQVLKENKVLRENCLRRSRNRTASLNEGKATNDVLPTKKQKMDVHRSAVKKNKRGRRSSSDVDSDSSQGKITDFFYRGSPRRKASTNSSKRQIRNGYKSKSSRTTESENSKSDEENADDRVERLSSLRSFSTGKETNLPPSPCPKCQIQQQNNDERISSESTRSPERRNKELRPCNMQSPRSRNAQSPRSRNIQSPRSRNRLLSSLRCSPTRGCGSLIASVCHATSVL